MHYILFYKYVPNYLEKREPFRAEHLRLLKAAHDRGELVMAGALNDPPDGAAIIFKGDDPSIAREVAVNDPYVQNGVVLEWDIRPWKVAVGAEGDAG